MSKFETKIMTANTTIEYLGKLIKENSEFTIDNQKDFDMMLKRKLAFEVEMTEFEVIEEPKIKTKTKKEVK